MEREIKFRAWDGKNMNYDVTIFNGRFIDCSCADEDIFYKWHDPSEQVAIMQHTGLKDKNGKEIYEGDVVKRHYGSSMPMFTVAWHPERLMFIQHDGYNEPLYQIPADYLEVIGNIYETPELLNEQ